MRKIIIAIVFVIFSTIVIATDNTMILSNIPSILHLGGGFDSGGVSLYGSGDNKGDIRLKGNLTVGDSIIGSNESVRIIIG